MDHLGVLTHRHAVALGVRAGEIQFQAVCDGGELFRHRDKLVHGSAKNRHQQKAISRYGELL